MGKSSLLMRFTADAFDEAGAPTIGTNASPASHIDARPSNLKI